MIGVGSFLDKPNQMKVERDVDAVIEEFDFLQIWGDHQDPRVHLVQETGGIVDYLVEECGEDPTWLYPPLKSYIQNRVWRRHGVIE